MSVFRERLQKRLGDDPQKKKFAKDAGISVRYLNALLNGERKNPSVDKAAAMAKAPVCPAGALLSFPMAIRFWPAAPNPLPNRH